MKNANPYMALEKLFHEPNRLAIMSALCSALDKGMSFNDLKTSCNLTDGNLSRHLKALEASGVVHITKAFVGSKPRTTVTASDLGRKSFVNYLKALEEVLKLAVDAVSDETKVSFSVHGEAHI